MGTTQLVTQTAQIEASAESLLTRVMGTLVLGLAGQTFPVAAVYFVKQGYPDALVSSGSVSARLMAGSRDLLQHQIHGLVQNGVEQGKKAQKKHAVPVERRRPAGAKRCENGPVARKCGPVREPCPRCRHRTGRPPEATAADSGNRAWKPRAGWR